MNMQKERWPNQATMLINRINKNRRKMKNWLKKNNVSCYRLYNCDIPEILLQIDLYEQKLHVRVVTGTDDDDEITFEWATFIMSEVIKELGVSKKDLYLKARRKGKGGSQYTQVDNKEHNFIVREGGLKFEINLSDHLDTGLFLDHRITRDMVRSDSKGKRVLNLFGYTGSFSIYAADGGAKTTTTIDLSNKYIDIARENMDRNGFGGFNHKFIKHDVLDLLRNKGIREKFDLVILDPPTISKSKSMKDNLVIQRDHAEMINQTMAVLSQGGILYFSNNYKKFKLDADNISASKIVEITNKTVPPDFANHTPHKCYKLFK